MQSPVQLSRGSHVRDAADAWSKGGKKEASCSELYLRARTFRNSLVRSRVRWWVAVKVQLMTIYILAVVFSVLCSFNGISRWAGMAFPFNLSTGEAEAGEFLCVQGQHGL